MYTSLKKWDFCQAQFQFQLASLAELSFALYLVFTTHPHPTPGIVVIWLTKHLKLILLAFYHNTKQFGLV